MPALSTKISTEKCSVSIPSRSGQCQHNRNIQKIATLSFQSPRDRGNASTLKPTSSSSLCFNPLEIGAMPALNGNIYNLALWGFNPLEIGAMPAHKQVVLPQVETVSIPSRSGQCQHHKPLISLTEDVSIPSRSGQCQHPRSAATSPCRCVSIPSRSGQCQHTILTIHHPEPFQSPRDRGNASTSEMATRATKCFNPLEIGAMPAQT